MENQFNSSGILRKSSNTVFQLNEIDSIGKSNNSKSMKSFQKSIGDHILLKRNTQKNRSSKSKHDRITLWKEWILSEETSDTSSRSKTDDRSQLCSTNEDLIGFKKRSNTWNNTEFERSQSVHFSHLVWIQESELSS